LWRLRLFCLKLRCGNLMKSRSFGSAEGHFAQDDRVRSEEKTKSSRAFFRPRLSSGHGELLFKLLLVVEAGVVAVEGEQFVVAAYLDNSAVVEHGNLIGAAHG
jgi:hypothetical protein